MFALVSKVSIFFIALWGFSAFALAQGFDKDIVISSAMQLDGAWTISIKDNSSNKVAVFDASKRQSKIGIELLEFDEKNCTAKIKCARGILNIALAERSNETEVAQGFLEDGEYTEASEEIIAAMQGKVTSKYRASIWKRIKR